MAEPTPKFMEGAVWYAFVESQDPFVGPRVKPEGRQWWAQVLEAREQKGLRRPNRIAWFSCIRAEYFQALPWRNEPCEIGNVEHSERRRARLLTLRPGAMRIIPLLLSTTDKEEYRIRRRLARHDWHRVQMNLGGKLPVFSATDFDVNETGGLVDLDYLGPCTPEELKALRAVFNLNFLPDADLGGERDQGPPEPILNPEPGTELQRRGRLDYGYAESQKARSL